MKVGIFDSGIGGVSVLNEAFHRLPNEEFIFYADVDHVPYGLKTSEQILGYADGITAHLIEMGADAILVACNTATAVAATYLREKYSLPIIGMEPAVKPAVEAIDESDGRILVMATPVTIREKKLKNLLLQVDKEHMVDLLPMPEFVRFAESGIFDGEEVERYIETQVATLGNSHYSVVVLGCTHFNYFKPAIRKCFNSIRLIDGNVGTIRHLAKVLGLDTKAEDVYKDMDIAERVYRIQEQNNRTTYLKSGRPVDTEERVDYFMRLHRRLEEVR